MDSLLCPPAQELEREKHAHSVLQFQFAEIKETLKQSEELLNVSVLLSSVKARPIGTENRLGKKTSAFTIMSSKGCMTLFTAPISWTLQMHAPL